MALRRQQTSRMFLLLALCLAIPGASAFGQRAKKSATTDGGGKKPPATDEAICKKVAKAPKLDGKLDDDAWKQAELIDRFPAYWAGVDPKSGMKAWIVWDDEALYFAATMPDTELKSFGTKRNDYLWNGDVFELFFKPSKEKPAYYEFQVNPKSVILEYPFPKRGSDVATIAALPPLGFKAVAVAEGTIDTPGDKDKSWTVEGRIPWSIFAPSGGKPKAGAAWDFALCRYDYGPEGTDPVLMSSAPLKKLSFHLYEDYGRLLFVDPKNP